ncbi:hypothetical protein FHT44_005155 [Mycolicibacterium sp. BK634]|uniref:hypothetical protein n=1 Tax=Mycolicibacterium sp. BK634 TaxID=2587099 RepID=UPI00160927F0|nr:hypothetical protein [Mycolicibacterium sp. BK634]MBB3752643.1 hypothetical protein [Mycolicibacterium sp. BK634]
MSEAMLPCFKCGKKLQSVVTGADNQPNNGTEFRTEGHYGSTFWDSFDGEELVLNICDDCLREHTERLAQHKRYLPVLTPRRLWVGKHWVERPMVRYTGNPDDGVLVIEPEEIGTYPSVEWHPDIDDIRDLAIRMENEHEQRSTRAG